MYTTASELGDATKEERLPNQRESCRGSENALI